MTTVKTKAEVTHFLVAPRYDSQNLSLQFWLVENRCGTLLNCENRERNLMFVMFS